MIPSLTVEIPSASSDGGSGADVFVMRQVKGAKTSGNVKVHNQFAGLDVE